MNIYTEHSEVAEWFKGSSMSVQGGAILIYDISQEELDAFKANNSNFDVTCETETIVHITRRHM